MEVVYGWWGSVTDDVLIHGKMAFALSPRVETAVFGGFGGGGEW